MCNTAPRFSAYIKADAPKDSRYLRIGRRLRTKGRLRDRSQIVRPREKIGAMKTVGGDPRRDIEIHIRDTLRSVKEERLWVSSLGLSGKAEPNREGYRQYFQAGSSETDSATQFLRNSESEEDFVTFVRA